MAGIGKTVAVAMAALAMTAPSPVPTGHYGQAVEGRVITMPAEQHQQRAPAQRVSARDEVRRVAELGAVQLRHRRQWDGKNRTSGDRAHKRMKQRRRHGR